MEQSNLDKQDDLFSIMELLKDHHNPSKLESLKKVQYSAVQMFAAANFANTQILAKHFEEFDDLKQTVNKLDQSLQAQTCQNEAQQKKIKALEEQIKSRSALNTKKPSKNHTGNADIGKC